MDLEEPRITYIGNITGRALRDAKTIAADITGNVAHTIRWHEGTMVLNELGCRTIFEMPPGHALTELAREALEDARVISISQTSFDYVVKISRGIST
jgi:malonate decarboxylase epsilon subunit